MPAFLAFQNLLYVADSFVFHRIPNLMPQLSYAASMPNWPNWCWLMFLFLSSYTMVANDIGIALLLFNRFTAVAWPILYRNIWRKILPFAIFAIFAIPLFSSFYSFNAEVAIQTDANGTISSVFLEKEPPSDANVSGRMNKKKILPSYAC